MFYGWPLEAIPAWVACLCMFGIAIGYRGRFAWALYVGYVVGAGWYALLLDGWWRLGAIVFAVFMFVLVHAGLRHGERTEVRRPGGLP